MRDHCDASPWQRQHQQLQLQPTQIHRWHPSHTACVVVGLLTHTTDSHYVCCFLLFRTFISKKVGPWESGRFGNRVAYVRPWAVDLPQVCAAFLYWQCKFPKWFCAWSFAICSCSGQRSRLRDTQEPRDKFSGQGVQKSELRQDRQAASEAVPHGWQTDVHKTSTWSTIQRNYSNWCSFVHLHSASYNVRPHPWHYCTLHACSDNKVHKRRNVQAHWIPDLCCTIFHIFISIYWRSTIVTAEN